jgi:hypothetical protein
MPPILESLKVVMKFPYRFLIKDKQFGKLSYTPKGMQALSLIPIVIFFLAGASMLFFVDPCIERKGGTMAQLLGMLSDFIPEFISMGTVFSQYSCLVYY